MGWKPSIQLPVGENIFLFTTLCSPLMLLSSVYHWLSPGVQWPGYEPDCSPPFNFEVGNVWSCTSTLWLSLSYGYAP